MKKTMTMMGAVVMVSLLSAPGAASASQTQSADDVLASRSLEATSAREHASVAREYRQRAESLERTASDYEAQASRLAERPRFPNEGKMVSHIRNRGDRERRLAAEARSAAQLAYQRADHHVRLAVEGQFAE